MSNKRPFNEVSLDCLVRDFYPYVRRLAFSILDNGNAEVEQEADDAVQDIFFLAARGLPGYRGEASPKTWLTTIAVNHCRGRLRKRRSRLRLLDRIREDQADPDPDTPEEWMLGEHRNHVLWAAVDRLPEKQRLPIVLHYVHELATADIAVVLGLPEGTVHSRLHHARRKLQSMLEAQDG